MQHRDLLKDQVEQIGKTLGKVIARFLSLKNRGSIEEAITQTNISLNDLLDFDIQFFLSATDKELQDYLLSKFKTAEHLEQLADYLIELGHQKEKENSEDVLLYYQKVMSLYELISTLTETFSFVRSKKEYTLRLKIEKSERA